MSNTKRNDKSPIPGWKLMKLLTAALIASMTWTAAVRAAECPGSATLGTSRLLRVDAATTPRVGLKQFPQTLPLRDCEGVLTFDDGRSTATTPTVRRTRAQASGRATFALTGQHGA